MMSEQNCSIVTIGGLGRCSDFRTVALTVMG